VYQEAGFLKQSLEKKGLKKFLSSKKRTMKIMSFLRLSDQLERK